MDAIIHHGPISRAQIAKLARISKQAASEVVHELEEGARAFVAALMIGVEASALGNRAGIGGALAIGINNIHNALSAPFFSPRVLALRAIAEIRGLGFAS